MALTQQETSFIEAHQSAAMVTLGADGTPKLARVGVAMVDGRLWSSGTRERVRTKRLRRDPRCTLFVYDPGLTWLALETEVTILDGPDAPAQNIRLFRVMQHRPTGPLNWFNGAMDEVPLAQALADEGRLIYQFEVHRSYGLLDTPGA